MFVCDLVHVVTVSSDMILCIYNRAVVPGVVFFFFKQKTAYEMRISDWSSDVCSSDLYFRRGAARRPRRRGPAAPPGRLDGPLHCEICFQSVEIRPTDARTAEMNRTEHRSPP